MIGAERAANPLLQAGDAETFADQLIGGLGEFPPYFLRLAELNRTGPPVLSGDPTLPSLDPDQIRAARAGGVTLVDVRPMAEFGAGHIPGSLSIVARPLFATWLGWLVDPAQEWIVVRNQHQDPAEILWQTLKIGHRVPSGEIAIEAWGQPLATVPLLRPEHSGGRTVVDVRQPGEYNAGACARRGQSPLGDLPSAKIPDDLNVMMCGHGERAATAASLLLRDGHVIAIMQGGPPDWATATGGTLAPSLGLRANAAQFTLLIAVNALVGGMLGQERTALPLLAEQTFQLAVYTSGLTYILAFGLTKAAANFFAGTWSDTYGRKPVLITGWLIGLPVPLMLIWAPSWSWVVAANVLLGINQGLTWSTTAIMKIDLVGPTRRGLAMGLNEAAGYLAVAVTAMATGHLAAQYGLRPAPFLLGLAYASLGLGLSVLAVKETRDHARHEAAAQAPAAPLTTGQIFTQTSLTEPTLSSASQAGMVNNLNDGLAWGLFPLLFAAHGLSIAQIGLLAALYPMVWGLGQLATGAASDRYGRKPFIVTGMLLQAAALALVAVGTTMTVWAIALILLGLGTAMVYPTLLAAIGDVAHPAARARTVGVYRLWRDSGCAVGALVSGLIADLYGITAAIWTVAVLTAASGLLATARMYEPTRQRPDTA